MAVFLSIWGPKEFSTTFWLGIAGWAAGLIGNGESIHDAETSLALSIEYELMVVYHDEILNDLRREPSKRLITSYDKEEEQDKKAGNGRYAIPRGGLFTLVSFPNYLCEW